MAQNQSINNYWKQIDIAFDNGQFSSLLPQINEVKKQAKKDNDFANYIKALFYEAKINIATSENTDDVNLVFVNFAKEKDGKSQVKDAIIDTYLAKLYQIYLNENQYKFRNRTKLENQISDDIRFWTISNFNNKIISLYKSALKAKQTLIKEEAKNWKLLLHESDHDSEIFTKNTELTSTIYDVIAQDYVTYLKQENQLKEANKILNELAELNIEKGNFNAFLFYQNQYLNNLKSEISTEEYLDEKEKLAAKFFYDAWYSAVIYNSLVDDLIEEKEFDKVFDIEKKLKNKYPDLASTKEVIQKVKTVRAKAYSVRLDAYVYPNQNIPVNITYKNLSKLFVRIYTYDPKFGEENITYKLQAYRETDLPAIEKILEKLKVVEQYAIDLKNFDDFQNHSTIAKLNPLKEGNYIVMFSPDNQFSIQSKENPVEFNVLSVTKHTISLKDNQLYVVDRHSGLPQINTPLQIFYKEGNTTKSVNYTTDKNGIAKIKEQNRSIGYKVVNDPVLFQNYAPSYTPLVVKNQTELHTEILTDRAIYRPGQIVYFKTISYQTKDKENSVVPNLKIDVILRDVNDKQIAQLEGITNEFGSFSGQFQLPSSVLTGNFTIEVVPQSANYFLDSSKTIKVEEYKRPKFEVKIDENKGVYKLNETIRIDGKAEAFSGTVISGAKVSYRVYRQEIYTFWPWYRSVPNLNNSAEEIAFGETETNNQGAFSFDFIAKPAIDKADYARLYTYKVEVKVTDINGETQTTTSVIKVGDNPLLVNVNLSQKINVDQLKDFTVSVINVNGVKQNVKGKVEIYQLQTPKQVLRKSNFSSDYNLYSEEEFRKLFPNQPYGDENNPKNWKIGAKVFEADFDTAISNQIDFPQASKLQENYYIVKAFILDERNKAEVEQLIYVSNLEKQNAYTLLNVYPNQSTYKVGEKAKVTFKSSTKDAYVYYIVSKQNGTEEEGVLNLKKKNDLTIPITKEDLGGISVSYFMIKYNDIEKGMIKLNVPYPSKDLTITTEVFRDKLLPGEKEKWQLKITGPNKEKISAEVLATMYDASLDQFTSHEIEFAPNLFGWYASNPYSRLRTGFGNSYASKINNIYINDYFYEYNNGLNFSTFNFSFNHYRYPNLTFRGNSSVMFEKREGNVLDNAVILPEPKAVAKSKELDLPRDTTQAPQNENSDQEKLNQIVARKVLDETAFFYPNLKTDQEGNVIIEFTAPESLTEWKLMTLAHTKDLKTGYLEQRIKTQKELMIVPNFPRFLRDGDEINVTAKISNLSNEILNGTAKLMLFDAFTMEPVDGQFNLLKSITDFRVEKGNSTNVNWVIQVPSTVQAVIYRVVAAAGNFTDGEESALPIVTNRMLVTETLPIYIKENQKKTFTFDHLKNNQSKTLANYKLTFEMTTNPIWYAVFALPYLREYPYECAEQVFSRLYGNMVSEKIVSSHPKIKAVFDQWNKNNDLKSKLEVNQELKNIILEETPWLRNSENESQQQKQIAALFQLNQMQNEMKAAFDKLLAKQQKNGGFAWFDGGNTNEYITTYIVSGFGNLKKMNVNFDAFGIENKSLIEKAINYIDEVNLARYKEFKGKQTDFKNIIYSDGIHYLYARSFFLDQFPMSKEIEEMKNVMLKNLNAKKLDLSLQQKAMAALILNRFGLTTAAKQVLNSVKETAVQSDEMGMYWKANQPGWFWYDVPIETQAALIEAFDEITDDVKSVEEMKVWLLKNKQTNQWNSTKATTKAVYALMNTGKSWIDAEKGISVQIANQPFDLDFDAKAGSGYVKKVWNETEITPDLGTIKVEKTSPGVAWGAMYWQYFENLDQIKSAKTGIKFNKKLYLKKNSANGPVLKEITTETPIEIGDIVTVRLEISIDRNMQFVHIKDMRASGFEPVNVLSGYKWNGEFGYYESTRDVATNFFADYMRKGTYVFEYDLKANNSGVFSNGITTMQNMYAPELSAHSEGIRVEIK